MMGTSRFSQLFLESFGNWKGSLLLGSNSLRRRGSLARDGPSVEHEPHQGSGITVFTQYTLTQSPGVGTLALFKACVFMDRGA